MSLQEAETQLSQIDVKITELLKERENALKEWTAAFNTENQRIRNGLFPEWKRVWASRKSEESCVYEDCRNQGKMGTGDARIMIYIVKVSFEKKGDFTWTG